MRFAISIAVAIVFTSTSIATEPRAQLTAEKKAPRAKPNDFQRVLARLAARDRATTNDVVTLLARPRPDLARFMLNRLPEQERQTGVREDNFQGPKIRAGPPQKIVDRIARIVVRPTELIARCLEPHLPTIPLIQRLEAKIERKLEARREVVRNLAYIASPHPFAGITAIHVISSRSMTLPSGHYLENHSPMYFPEQPGFRATGQ